MIGTGGPAPDWQLKRLDGGAETLTGLLAKSPVLLVFFKVSCPTCQFTLPFLERMAGGRGKPFSIVLISQDNAQATQAFRREFGITLPTLLDEAPGYTASNAYEISSVPSLFRIDATGQVVAAETGFDRELLREWGRELGVEVFQPGEKVPASQYG